MQQKSTITFHVDVPLKRILFVVVFLSSIHSSAQLTKVDLQSQVLLMQLGAGYLNVASQTQIDLDSGLLLAARRNHLNRMLVIGENYEDILTDPANKWVAQENMTTAKQRVTISKGLKRIELLNLISAFYVFQPTSRKNDLDSAIRYLELAKQEAEAAHNTKNLTQALCYLGKYYLESGNIPVAATTFTNAINLSAKSGDQAGEARALTFWAAYSPFQPATILERIDHLKKALAIYQQTNDKIKQILVLTYIGYLSFAAGNIKESEQAFLKTLEIEKKTGFPFTQYTTDLLSLIYGVSKNKEAQLKYAMDVIGAAEATKDSVALGYFYERRGNADFRNNTNDFDFSDRIEWQMKALNEFIRTGDEKAIYQGLSIIVTTLNLMHKESDAIPLIQDILRRVPAKSPIDRQYAYLTLGKAYKGIRDYPMAEKYFLMAESTQKDAEKIRGKIKGFYLYFQIGSFYFDNKEYDKSLKAYNTALTYYHNDEIYDEYEQMIFNLAIIDSVKGHFDEAFKYMRMYSQMSDSGWSKIASKQTQEMRQRYEADKKDKDIKILNQQSQIQQAEITQGKFTRNVMITGASLLLFFLGFVYFQFRAKQKTNKKLENLVDEKEFLLKEIHHRVKNNLQIVISLLNTQSKFLNNEEAIAAISESRHRMQAMSLIHQKLYQSENVAFVGMTEYVRDLIEYLKNSSLVGNEIHFKLDVDPIDLDISQAIPIGLIINEAVTNCIKHAFDNQSDSRISIRMKKEDHNDIYLEIADNGKGLSPDQNISFSQSMGMRLIRGLTEQIGGKLSIRNENGLVLSTTFRQDLILKAVAV